MTEHQQHLLNYLQANVAMRHTITDKKPGLYWCIEDYLLQHGKWFESQSLTKDERAKLLLVLGKERFPIKECFSNSQKVIVYHKRAGLKYFEGYFFREGICFPILHGWLSLNDKVIDLTARLKQPRHSGRLRNRVLGEFPEGRVYFGAEMDLEWILSRILRTKSWGSLLDSWEEGFPLLTKGEW